MGKSLAEKYKSVLKIQREKLGNVENAYLNDLKLTASEGTLAAYAQDLVLFKTAMHRIHPVDNYYQYLSRRDIVNYLSELTGNKVETQGRKLATIKSFFDWLTLESMVDKNPALNIKIKMPHVEIKFRITPEEAAKLIEVIKPDKGRHPGKAYTYQQAIYLRDICLVSLLLTTGLRVSEAVGINMGDVLEADLKIKRKGGKEVFIPIPFSIRDQFTHYIIERKKSGTKKDDPLFATYQNKQAQIRLSSRSIYDRIKTYGFQAGISEIVTPHCLRRFYGTEVYRRTGDISLASELLGHRSIDTTRKHYANESIGRKREVMEGFTITT